MQLFGDATPDVWRSAGEIAAGYDDAMPGVTCGAEQNGKQGRGEELSLLRHLGCVKLL